MAGPISSAASTIQPPVYKPEEYTVASVILKFFEDKAKDLAKVFGYTGFWLGQAAPNLSLGPFSERMGEFKNFVSATEIPKKMIEAKDSYVALFTALTSGGRVEEAARKAFTKTTSAFNSIVDSIDLASRFTVINTTVMTWLKGLNFGATLGGSSVGAYEQYEKYQGTKPYETVKAHFYAINFLRDATYASVGAYGLGCMVTATPLIPWVMVGLLTVGLLTTIGGYFFEKLHDPEGAGKNLNPDLVIANIAAKNRYEAQLAAASGARRAP